MQKTKIALIGCGIWGQKILRDLVTLHVHVTIYDESVVNKDDLLALGAVAILPGYPQEEDKYHGIIVATPSTTHRNVLERILPLGIPIFLEKPLTTNYEDALALSKILNSEVYLMHIWLYHPGILCLAKLAASGELGEVLGLRTTRANWTSPRRDTDSWWNLAPHDLTITKAILGEIPKPTAAIGEYHEGICRGMFALLGKSPYSIIEVSNRYERKVREVRLHCTGGVAVLQNEQVDYVSIYRGTADSAAKDLTEEKKYFHGPSPLFRELQEFLDYLNGGPTPRSSFTDGLEIIKLLNDIECLAKQPENV